MTPQQLEQRLSELLAQHGASLRLFASTWSSEPDDCVQQALISLVSQDKWPGNVRAWLFRVVRNESINRHRRSRRRLQRERSVARPETTGDWPSGHIEQPDDSDLSSALDQLDAKVREVVVAKIWGGLTFEEVARLCRCSASAAHRRYQSGLEQLRQILAGSSRKAISE